MSVDLKVKLDFKSYWRPGTGRGSGSHVDALAETDRFGCPFISGRQLKGVLRDAADRLLQWNCLRFNKTDPSPEDTLEILFGSWGFVDNRPRNETRPGLIRVGDAVLDDETRGWLKANPQYCQRLFRDVYTTAIDAETGVAKQASLRGEQVVVPLSMSALVTVDRPSDETTDVCWVYNNAEKIIEGALPLIRNIGAGRSRGLGRVELALETVS